ncbi:MAG: LysM peptidoglycan-binding domain-containing protein [Planctomycetota bacterium]|nr:LysM peptidoglycan-binding domain-containing protein [Planctomycetota bacterium]
MRLRPFLRSIGLGALGVVLACTSASAESASQARLKQTAVRIRYERSAGNATVTGHGTAFGADLSKYGYAGRRYLLSAAHNVLDDNGEPFSTVKIELDGEARTVWSRCRVLAFDKDLDLCLLEANDDLPALAELADFEAEAGADLVLVGSPRGIPIKVFEGTLTRRFESGTIRSAARVPFDHGDSGGPFFCSRTGKVVGVAVAGVPKDGDLDHTIGLFVPVSGVLSFMERHRAGGARQTQVSIRTERAAERPAPVVPAALTAPAEPAPKAEEKELAKSIAVKAPETAANAPRSETKLVLPAHVTPAKPQLTIVAAPEPQIVAEKPNKPPEIALAETQEAAIPAPKEATVYVVQDGDNLTKIAKRFNVSLNDLIAANNIRNPNVIYVGAKLRIP